MRGKKAVYNSATALLSQFVTIICGFILPRLILSAFGSSYNGITQSITQFLNCVILLRAGVGGVTRAALYKPLAEENNTAVSGIVNATQVFMKKVSIIFAVALIAFACIYPFMIRDQFDWLFSATLVLIIGFSTFAQNYFGITYQMLIQADQRQYIYSIITIITTILNTVVAAALILYGFGIHIVKLGSTIVFTLNPIVLNLYVKKRYKLNSQIAPDNTAISQRWDAFAQQAAAFVNNNTDVIVLTAFSNLKEVSVYTVYYMVANGLCRIEQTLTNGIDAAFGNMMAKHEENALQENTRLFELLTFASSSFMFICGSLLIVPFVEVYTKGVSDVSYSRLLFGVLMCINQFLFCVRLPYQMLVEAAGHFKQTRNGAIFESVLNIVISVALVIQYGLIGVTVGTFCALLFRTIQYATYASKNILHRSMLVVGKQFFVSILEAVTTVIIFRLIPMSTPTSYSEWLLNAIIVAIIAAISIGGFSLVMYFQDTKLLFRKLIRTIRR